MFVNEILKDSILNLNLNARDPKVLSRAVSLFNSIMRRYSGNNLMTAYQSSIDFTAEDETVSVGRYALRDGFRDVGVFPSLSDIPAAENFVRMMDIACVGGAFYTPSEDAYSWEAVDDDANLCSFYPDVLCVDISDVVKVIVRDGDNWRNLEKIPFASFFTDTRNNGFSSRPIGENKVEILVKPAIFGKQLKMIYTTSMKFDENSSVELPEIYLPLITAALTEDLGNAFPAVDETIVNKYSRLRERLESDIMGKNADDRIILREGSNPDYGFNRIDMWG